MLGEVLEWLIKFELSWFGKSGAHCSALQPPTGNCNPINGPGICETKNLALVSLIGCRSGQGSRVTTPLCSPSMLPIRVAVTLQLP